MNDNEYQAFNGRVFLIGVALVGVGLWLWVGLAPALVAVGAIGVMMAIVGASD